MTRETSNLINFIEDVTQHYIVAASFRGRHPTKFKSNAPLAFKISYTIKRMFTTDPVVSDVGNVEGWVAWRDHYDLSHKAFRHCQKYGMAPERGHSFFFTLGEEHSVASIVLRPNMEFTKSLQDDLAISIITFCEAAFRAPETELELTEIQIDIMMQIRAGKREKQIAHSLGVSIKTIQTHKRSIERSLRVETFHQAIIKATKAGIFD